MIKSSMTQIYINNIKFVIKSDISILEASSFLGFNISRFCYHESLSVVGNCRICLVEIEKSLRPVASCALPIIHDIRIHIDTPLVKKARESVIEALLINHPLDCPICDQAGECDLQDLTKVFGGVFSRNVSQKRTVEDKDSGSLVKTIMTRCIHCTRCVRFISEVAGTTSLGTFNRGTSTEIGGYIPLVFDSELSGNVIDLCPVGALTSKSYAFKSRPWGLNVHESIDLTDCLGSNTYVHRKELDIIRILPKKNSEINGNFISDKARFSYDSNKYNRLLKPRRKAANEHLDELEESDEDRLEAAYQEFYENSLLKQMGFARVPPEKEIKIDGDLIFARGRFPYGSHKYKRLLKPTRKIDIEDSNEYEPDHLYWTEFLLEIEANVELKEENILMIISNNLDLDALEAAKMLSNYSEGRIKIRVVDYFNVESNFVENHSINRIEEIQAVRSRFCFILSSNLKLECSILNSKLRAKYLNEELSMYSLGNPFITNMPLEFVVVATPSIMQFLEGKSSLSLKYISKKAPLFFIGESFSKRFEPVSMIIKLIKVRMPTAIVITIHSYCNSKGTSLLGIKPVSSRDVSLAEVLIFVDLDDTFLIRSAIEDLESKTSYWLNSHHSEIANECDYTLPTRSLLEADGIYINLENRPQRTFKDSSKSNYRTAGSRSTLNIFRGIEEFLPCRSLTYIKEMAEDSKMFSLSKPLLSTLNHKSDVQINAKISQYPLISSIEDFYTKGCFLKNSLTMLKCSQDARKNSRLY